MWKEIVGLRFFASDMLFSNRDFDTRKIFRIKFNNRKKYAKKGQIVWKNNGLMIQCKGGWGSSEKNTVKEKDAYENGKGKRKKWWDADNKGADQACDCFHTCNKSDIVGIHFLYYELSDTVTDHAV